MECGPSTDAQVIYPDLPLLIMQRVTEILTLFAVIVQRKTEGTNHQICSSFCGCNQILIGIFAFVFLMQFQFLVLRFY